MLREGPKEATPAEVSVHCSRCQRCLYTRNPLNQHRGLELKKNCSSSNNNLKEQQQQLAAATTRSSSTSNSKQQQQSNEGQQDKQNSLQPQQQEDQQQQHHQHECSRSPSYTPYLLSLSLLSPFNCLLLTVSFYNNALCCCLLRCKGDKIIRPSSLYTP